uniref:UxaA family hydrolase n=1 Tax=Pararhizobium sp. IMCC3301 TaxID=3067904 RepID=UPI00274126C5|nr:UxaA family hydrolase [Pararhizobium sp. IMCC3301]
MSGTEQAGKSSTRLSLKTHPGDNVATMLDDRLDCTRIVSGMEIVEGVPFGHKVALSDIAAGAEVVKYGVVIGHAKTAILQGEHVHVHNIA